MPTVRTPYVRRAKRRLNLQFTSLMLSVFAHLFTPLLFSNSVLAKLTINTFTGMCPAVFLHILKYWYRHITAVMWLYNALKLKKTYSFTVSALFGGYSKCPAVFCGFQSYPDRPKRATTNDLTMLHCVISTMLIILCNAQIKRYK